MSAAVGTPADTDTGAGSAGSEEPGVFTGAEARAGQVAENPVTKERSIVLEAPGENAARRLVAELHLVPGAHVALEHMHPGLEERFEVVEGRLGWKLDGREGIAGPGDALEIPAGSWHDWWHHGSERTVCRVTVTPGDRFLDLIGTLWGLGMDRLTDAKGAPKPLQLVAVSQEFSDIFVPRRPPAAVRRAVFGLLGPLARRRGYRGVYPRYRELTFRGTPADVRAGRELVPEWGPGAGPPDLER